MKNPKLYFSLFLSLMAFPSISLSQHIIKIHGQYILIDTDKGIGSIKDVIPVYRTILGYPKIIAYVQIVKFNKNMTAAKITNYNNGYNSVKINDFVRFSKYLNQKENIPKITLIGYSATLSKSTSQFIGISIASINNNFGLLVSLRFGGMFLSSKNSNYYEDLSGNPFGDQKIETKQSNCTIDIGTTKYIFNKTYLITGVGVTMFYRYNQYYDPYQILGNNGEYWVNDKKTNCNMLNLLLGLLYYDNKSRFGISFSYCLHPQGINIGIYFNLI